MVHRDPDNPLKFAIVERFLNKESQKYHLSVSLAVVVVLREKSQEGQTLLTLPWLLRTLIIRTHTG